MTPHGYSFVLDSGAMSAVASGHKDALPWLEVARQSDSVLYVSTVTLVEVTDGSGRDANVRRSLGAVRTVPVTDSIGFTAGRLRRHAAASRSKARDLTVDAVVAATALAVPGPVVVLTSDTDDLSLLLQDTPVRVELLSG